MRDNRVAMTALLSAILMALTPLAAVGSCSDAASPIGASPVPGFYPYDAKDVLVKTPEPCHPCGIHICPKKGDDNMACMKKIPVDVVMRYVDELLDEYGDAVGAWPEHYGASACRGIDVEKEAELA